MSFRGRLWASIVLLIVVSQTSRGEFIITFSQNGSDVVATGSGTIDTGGFTSEGSGPAATGTVLPGQPYLIL